METFFKCQLCGNLGSKLIEVMIVSNQYGTRTSNGSFVYSQEGYRICNNCYIAAKNNGEGKL